MIILQRRSGNKRGGSRSDATSKLRNDGRGGNKERRAWRPTIGHLYLHDIVHRDDRNRGKGNGSTKRKGRKELSKIKLISCIRDSVEVAFPYRTWVSRHRLSSRRSAMLLSRSRDTPDDTTSIMTRLHDRLIAISAKPSKLSRYSPFIHVQKLNIVQKYRKLYFSKGK